MSNGCIYLDKKICPDPLEALKPSGDLKTVEKIWGRLESGGPGAWAWGPPGLPMPYVGSSLICPLRAAYGLSEDPSLTTCFCSWA